MWFSLFATVLILAVTFYQGLQGTFSALINCILTILAAALAFGFYDDLYAWQLAAYQPDHGRAIALIAVFVISLLLLRLIVDQLITGNMHFHVYVDRAGGGLFGFITAMIIIGTLSVGFEMLPFEPNFLGFSRYSLEDRSSNKPVANTLKPPPTGRREVDQDTVPRDDVDWNNVRRTRHNLWLNPDGFTVALVSYLSSNALQGRNRFADLNPDFLDYLHDIRDGLGRESLAGVSTQAVRVKGYRYLGPNEPIYKYEKTTDPNAGTTLVKPTPADRKPDMGCKWLAVSVSIDEKADTAQDKQTLNFTASQVRLLARERTDGEVKAFTVVGVSDPDSPHLMMEVKPAQDIQYKRGQGGTNVALLFEVPDSPGFQPPWLLQYKYNALAEISVAQNETGKKSGRPNSGNPPKPRPANTETPLEENTTSPEPALPPNNGSATTPPDNSSGSAPPPPNPGSSGSPPNPNPPDKVHGVNLADREPFFSDALPFRLTDYSEGPNFERAGSKLKGTHDLAAKLSDDWKPATGSNPPLDTFEVPEGMRMLQCSVAKLHPESWLGAVLGTATDQIRNIYLIDSNGKQYLPVGKYAIARLGGEVLFELTYLDETERGFSRMTGFDHIKFSHLKGQYAYVFLFHVPPGTRPDRFHTGRTDIPLAQFNLVAPK